MNALNFHQTQRSDAIEWWNALDMKQKTSLARKHFLDRNMFTLTGREIENIFKIETHG